MTMKAFSLLEVKELDEEKRIISGIASTPRPDRMSDVVVSTGAVFKTPMPLLLYHNGNLPVGNVVFAKATDAGIPFTASIPNVIESGTVKNRVDEAWHSIKYRLIGAVSIGFRALEDGVELLKNGGLKFTSWEWLELSLVAIPAQPDALIQSFKSMDSAQLCAALGASPSDESERVALIKKLQPTPSTVVGQSTRAGVLLLPVRSGPRVANPGAVALIPRNET